MSSELPFGEGLLRDWRAFTHCLEWEAGAGSRLYDAFGNDVSSAGTWASRFAYAGNFGYQHDTDTGLRLLGHRYYDPSMGRFLTRDLAKAGENWYSYCDNNPVTYHDADGLDKIVIVKGGEYSRDKGLFDDIIDDIKREHPNDEIVVVDNADDAYDELEDADELVWVGHYEPVMEGEWDPEIHPGFDTSEGDTIYPHEISKRRKGKRLKKIMLIGCNTLTHPANAAAWGRLCDGNLYGTTYDLNIKYYAWGWTASPASHLIKYDPDFRPTKTWSGGRKKGKGIGAGRSRV